MDIMIDIETLSLQPNATILSIGAVEFSKTAMGDEFYAELDPRQDRHLDPETCLWWARQSSAFLSTNQTDLHSALCNLKNFINLFGGGARIWANSPVFDLAILKSAFEQFGIPCPWKFYQERDIRTVKDFIRKGDLPAFEGTKHNALDDAKHQAKLVQIFLDRTGTRL